MAQDPPTSYRGPLVSEPRQLLARVRDVMAGAGENQVQFDQITKIIATYMVAEVCSIYIRRSGDQLELYSTQGLKPSAVHNTFLRVGEGIVGDIAAAGRPFALADAQAHPNFAYRPETGEEFYSSLMGVPILRGGRVIGVLDVQNRTKRDYTDEEVETLQTVAMVLAELIAGGTSNQENEFTALDEQSTEPIRIEGIMLSEGLGIGRAHLHSPRVNIEKMVADNPLVERQRLEKAFREMHGALDEMLADKAVAKSGEHKDVLETYRLIAEDAGWLKRMQEAINTGLSAEASVQKVQNDIRARMGQTSDPYLRERVHDFDDLAHRLMKHLMGENGDAGGNEMPDEAILIARSMGPAQLLDYDASKLKGLVLEEGSSTSHVAIVARAMGIPVIGRAPDVLSRVNERDLIIVDANHGQVLIRPGKEAQNAFNESVAELVEQKERYAALIDKPAITRDGEEIKLLINAGLMIDLAHLEETGASGVGLYRTEIPFMVRSKFPGVDEQTRLYNQVLDNAGGKPVIFRTLDIGGDKVLPYWEVEAEDNPSMGWRAIRVALDRPALLRRQLRAMIRAAAGRDLYIMFPMVAEVSEFVDAKALVDKEMEREKQRGAVMPRLVEVGVMLEVPSLAFQLPALCPLVDFISVGSNDLCQFLFASDRGNPRLSSRYDTLSPVVLKFLKSITDACDLAGVPVSLCGEMAGRPLEAMALAAIGFRRLSMTGSSIGPVKEMILGLQLSAMRSAIEAHLDMPDHSLRETISELARLQGISV
ncbi:MAG: phosphoenolpyruvate--protein phosphotransferase [Rhodospirillales bacterium]|nr:phosphoenolpyruvate--protein phosphotransferase [Rhodospirillales bacterium]